jgi:hypothetical protein
MKKECMNDEQRNGKRRKRRKRQQPSPEPIDAGIQCKAERADQYKEERSG